MSATRINPTRDIAPQQVAESIWLDGHGRQRTLTLLEKYYASGWTTYSDAIPQGSRPGTQTKGALVTTDGSGYCGIVNVNTNGTVGIFQNKSSSQALAGTITWFV